VKKKWYDIGYQIDKLLISSFLPPFFMSFFIAVFVLIMQFMWKFIDDILGKGVSSLVILELFFYKSVSLFPLAFPIAVLLASVMVMGNLAERYELASFKSAGVPLTRIIRPLVGVAILIGIFSFYCSNTIIPLANLKYQARLYDIRKTKPTLSIEAGIFNEDFQGYSIRIGKKHSDKETIEDIMVYDDTQRNRGKLSVVTAKKGRMYVSPDDGAFVLTLYDGHQYSESDLASSDATSLPFVISNFTEWTRRFDLSEFDSDQTEESQFSHHTMKSARQIAIEIDTLDEQIRLTLQENLQPFLLVKESKDSSELVLDAPTTLDTSSAVVKLRRSVRPQGENARIATKYQTIMTVLDTMQPAGASSVESLFPLSVRREFKSTMFSRLSVAQSTFDRTSRTMERLDMNRRKHVYELHWKFSLAAACIAMLLIGGPMGTIVRKGGFGYPLLISIIFFTFFIMANISCKKLNEARTLPPELAAWLPVIFLSIIAVFLMRRALRDAKMIDVDRIKAFITRLLPRPKLKPA
jgi:lipopolysaccharide export system permease protein